MPTRCPAVRQAACPAVMLLLVLLLAPRVSTKKEVPLTCELREYLERRAQAGSMDCEEAYRSQAQPSSADVGLEPWDTMMELESIPLRLAFINQLHSMVCGDVKGSASRLKVATYTMWGGDIWGLRRTMLPYIQWGIHIGICRFFVLYPGEDASVLAYLKQVPAVKLYLTVPPFEADAIHGAWQRYLGAVIKPSSVRTATTHYVMQDFGNAMAIVDARTEGFQWLMHIDSDELILPATSLYDELLALPRWKASLIVKNLEAHAEAVDIVNKYEQATLFRGHEYFFKQRGCEEQASWRLPLGERRVARLLYVNGKALVRVDGPPVRPWGLHNYQGLNDQESAWTHPNHNPNGEFVADVSNNTVVLHYAYLNWHDLLAKVGRRCPKEQHYDAAMAENITALQACFLMRYDKWAYMAAVRGPQAARRFWVAHTLLSEGAYTKAGEGCQPYPDVRWLKDRMVQSGVLRRIGVVRETLRAHEVSIRLLAGALGIRMQQLGAGPQPAGADSLTGIV